MIQGIMADSTGQTAQATLNFIKKQFLRIKNKLWKLAPRVPILEVTHRVT